MTVEYEPSDFPILDKLVEEAHEKFKTTERFINEYGREEVYNPFQAASDAVEESDIDPFRLFRMLCEQTSLTPNDVSFIDLEDGGTWEQAISMVNGAIVSAELLNRYPEIEEQANARDEASG